jgi:hypothetical protein
MDYGGHRGIHRSGRRVGVAPRRMLRRGTTVLRVSRIPEAFGSNRFGLLLACVEDGARPATPSEEREEPMSEDSASEDEQPEVDDGTLSEVVRRPTRTAGDLSEVADASPGITTEDLARDLEAVASRPGVRTERELLEDLLRRVRRIEEYLGLDEY